MAVTHAQVCQSQALKPSTGEPLRSATEEAPSPALRSGSSRDSGGSLITRTRPSAA
jgi:hypothetical protein